MSKLHGDDLAAVTISYLNHKLLLLDINARRIAEAREQTLKMIEAWTDLEATIKPSPPTPEGFTTYTEGDGL